MSTADSDARRARLLLDSVTAHGLALIDDSGKLVSWSGGAAAITGFAAEEIVGRFFGELFA